MISLHEGRGSRRKRPVDRALTLHLQVAGCEPRIWRRLVVRESMWLTRLHESIQTAFNWYDYQTHAFIIDDLRYGNPVKRDELTIEDDRDFRLLDLDLMGRGSIAYEYHFGEGWRVEIAVEEAAAVLKGFRYPACVAGERAGPPEDCGGVEAFHDMLASIREPHTELGREWLEWLGPDYDPAACDPVGITKALRPLAR
ncbi:MAG: hypothetical protein RLZZ188_2967 [Verrucomicrobiota bacterium]|jgi:hypothetical protein